MQGNASVATDVLASYAADAAREVEGVAGLVEGRLPRHGGVRVSSEDGIVLELHLAARERGLRTLPVRFG